MYNKQVRYGEVITVEEFKQGVENDSYIDYDGFGYPAQILYDDTFTVRPSVVDNIPADATHVVWFNK